jgi:hypothetical protein
MRSYCQYLAQRFGFPRVAAELLEVSIGMGRSGDGINHGIW